MGLYYASGPKEETTGIPASAFRKGDLLVFNSASSLSRAAVIPAAGTIVGVALAHSTQSIANQVPYIVVRGERTVFWSDMSSVVTIAERGAAKDLGYITFPTSATSEWVMLNSANTPCVRVEPNGSSHDVIDSARSRCRVVFNPDILLYAT